VGGKWQKLRKRTLLRISRKVLVINVRHTFITVIGNVCDERCIAVPGTKGGHLPISLHPRIPASTSA
jgi:hypothetical protein